MVSKSGCAGAVCCSMLSICGFVFLLAIGVLVQVQPQYMKLGKNVESPAPIFETAVLYGAIFVVSTTVWYMENKKSTGDTRYHQLATTSDERKPLLAK
ncbi:TPA: hypothetical protein N0F65_001937 [Lagenidium giganteum]|uniref:Uncharacterized protein n=1 Tax=Lagenidium giganteum TaxID=4803 RepID=A0AAV2YSU1_9STRA|nr:TPA: hypothetical protein N0F65_001937 [Lagenidium giganteum]